MDQKYDVIVYRGRFQGFHNAHLKTILMALQHAKKVVVVIGSANEPRTYYRNPFFEDERIEMIRGALEDHYRHEDVSFVTVEDDPSDQRWSTNVEYQVWCEIGRLFEFADDLTHCISYKIGQIGFKKDENCVRDVDLFPDWDYIETPHFEPLDATQIRDVLFSQKSLDFLRGVCPESVIQYMTGFRVSDDFINMMEEKAYVEEYKRKFAGLEYAPTFVTGDNVAIKDRHVLLVKRKIHPGKGLWALPAGYFNAADRRDSKGVLVKADKTVFACAVRELFEETKADLTEDDLNDALVYVRVFDEEGRDPRGRIITHAHVYDLDAFPEFTIEAADDAEDAAWFNVDVITRRMMYADHFNIIKWGYNAYVGESYNF